MKKHLKILELTSIIARDVIPVNSAKIAASIYYKNKLISVGKCTRKTDPFQKNFGKNIDSICLHAEVDAIKKALKRLDLDDLKKCNMYISRVKKELINNEYVDMVGLVKPCIGCQRALAAFNIKKVYYTVESNIDDIRFECL